MIVYLFSDLDIILTIFVQIKETGKSDITLPLFFLEKTLQIVKNCQIMSMKSNKARNVKVSKSEKKTFKIPCRKKRRV